MPDEGSVSHLLFQLKAGDPEAARLLWERYFRRLTALARKRLKSLPRRESDEEDVVQSVFKSLCLGAADGHFPELFDRNDLWPLLARLTQQKVADQFRRAGRQKRGGGKVRGDSALDAAAEEHAGSFDQLPGGQPTPEFIAEMTERCTVLFRSMRDETLKLIAWSRLEGHANDEIARLLGITTRSVERKLKLIRDTISKQPPQ